MTPGAFLAHPVMSSKPIYVPKSLFLHFSASYSKVSYFALAVTLRCHAELSRTLFCLLFSRTLLSLHSSMPIAFYIVLQKKATAFAAILSYERPWPTTRTTFPASRLRPCDISI